MEDFEGSVEGNNSGGRLCYYIFIATWKVAEVEHDDRG